MVRWAVFASAKSALTSSLLMREFGCLLGWILMGMKPLLNNYLSCIDAF